MSPDNPFDSLPREIAPPPTLRARTVSALRVRGLLQSRPTFVHLTRAAAAALLLAVGAVAGRLLPPTTLSDNPMPDARDQFALLLYEPSTFDTSRTHEQLAREYGEWAGSLGADFVGGEALGEARVLGGAAPAFEPTGFFLVRASSYEAAVSLAQNCPHLKYGGIVSVRTVPPT